MSMINLLFVTAAVAASVCDAAAPAVTWLSQPVYPSQTLMVHGAFFMCTGPAACVNATLSTTSPGSKVTRVLSAVSGQVSASSAKFTVPADMPVDVYELTLTNPDSSASAPVLVNAATPWWMQGDIGNAATQGGWLRVFGLALALQPPSDTLRSLQHQIRVLRDTMTSGVAAVDQAWGADSQLAAWSAELLSLRAQLQAVLAANTSVSAVILTPAAGGNPIYLPADASNVSSYSAYVALPSDLPTGDYYVSITNGFGASTSSSPFPGTYTAVDFFESASRPSVTSISVQSPKSWPSGVFVVSTPTDPCSLPCPTSDASLSSALQAAASAGGGTVLFPRGRYFLTQPIVVPPNTVLAGERTDLSAIWFSEASPATAPPIYIQLNATLADTYGGAPCMGSSPAGMNLTSWGLANLTLYITAFHNVVISVNNRTDGWILQNVRTRVNAYTFTWGPGTVSRNRWANWTDQQLGHLIDLHSVNNRLTDNDLFATSTLINSFYPSSTGAENSWPNWRRGHQYSYMARNVLWNGIASHFMQLWRQVIFEQNAITGATENAGGQSVGTGPMGGMAQHIYHGENTIRFTWGGDREVMTYDDAGGAYFGAIASMNGTVLTTLNDTYPASDWEMGGWYGGQVLVLNGTGMLQTRRIVVPGVNTTASPSNRTWVLDRPFDVAPDVGPSGSFVEIMPFRGRNIFHRDRNVDVGPHQFYGHSVEGVVAEVWLERQRGLIAWGQWRGWIPPPLDEGVGLGGQMGNGMQPNVHSLYYENEHLEGNHLTNYNCSQTGYVEWWGGKTVVMYPAAALNSSLSSPPMPIHMGLVYRGTAIGSNGGFWVGNDTSDVIIEDSIVLESDSDCVIVGPAAELVFTSNNQC